MPVLSFLTILPLSREQLNQEFLERINDVLQKLNRFFKEIETEGSVVFLGPNGFKENNANLYWDDTNKRLGIGTASPATTVHLATDPAAHTLNESTSTPANPTSANQCRYYMKADKFVIQYNDVGTVRYKYLDLKGTGVTWVHTTTPP